MAYIISEDFDDKFTSTVVVYDGGREALDHFFDTTDAHPGTIASASWVTGTVIPPEVVPKRLRITEGAQLYDWRTIRSGGTLVSSAFREAVESIEPQKHQFFPVTVLENGGHPRAQDFYIFNIVGRIEAIIEERSNLHAVGRGQITSWEFERNEGPWRCALDAAVIGRRACWIEHRYDGRCFVSDRLAASLEKRRLSGFRLSEHCDEIAR